MADRQEDFAIQESTVYRRDESPMGLFGWTWSDMIIVASTFFVSKWATQSTLPALMMTALAWLYVKKLKDKLPERFFSKFIAYNLDRHSVYRALARDTDWAPPVIVGQAKSPLVAVWEGLVGPPRPNPAKKAESEKRAANLRERGRR